MKGVPRVKDPFFFQSPPSQASSRFPLIPPSTWLPFLQFWLYETFCQCSVGTLWIVPHIDVIYAFVGGVGLHILLFFNRRIIALQWCVGFCHTIMCLLCVSYLSFQAELECSLGRAAHWSSHEKLASHSCSCQSAFSAIIIYLSPPSGASLLPPIHILLFCHLDLPPLFLL